MPDWENQEVFKGVPAIWTTPERWKARFNTLYQAKRIYWYGVRAQPNAQDLEAYCAHSPEEGDKVRRMYAATRMSGYGTLLGAGSGTAYVASVSRNVPLLITGALLSSAAGYFVTDDVASWVYGTYKFDAGASNERFVKWVYETRRTPPSE